MGKERLCKGRQVLYGYSNCLGNRLWITTHLQMDIIETHGESRNCAIT
jgi:hypothetical protein